MLKLLGKIPEKLCVAVSGGPDSMVALDFFRRSNRDVSAAFVHHGTTASSDGENVVKKYCSDFGLKMHSYQISSEKPKGQSQEEFWRNERYSFFRSLGCEVVTAHHLDDVVETWFFTTCHGNPKLIPYRNGCVIRPFLLNTKAQMIDWAERKSVNFITDVSNSDEKYMRNYVRKNIIPHVKSVNPGINKVIRKKIISEFKELNGCEQSLTMEIV